MNKKIIFTVAACILGATTNALTQSTFSSGSTGAQGAFPPSALANLAYNTLTVDLKTAVVTATTGGTVVGSASLAGGAASGDAFPTGDLDFTTFSVPPGITLNFVPNTFNTPVTIRTTGDANVHGTIDVKGGNGKLVSGFSLPGKGGVGGFDGGKAGTGQSYGSPGLGTNGGYGGVNGGGGGGQFPHNNNGLMPLIGGSGGGGGKGSNDSSSGGSGAGGGGGGAVLIASSTKISVTGLIDASGGNGGSGSNECYPCAGAGGGGSGGGIRLIASRLEVSGSLKAMGGAGGDAYYDGLAGIAGRIRLETFDFVISPSAIVSPPASPDTPGVVRPLNVPRLRITSIGGISVPDTPVGATSNVDVQLPATNPPANPMPVVVTATLIPDGTTITVSIKGTGSPGAGTYTTATGTLTTANGVTSTSVNITVPGGVNYMQAYSNTFNLSAELQNVLPLFNGEKLMQAAVEFDGERDHTYFYTASGKKVSAEALLNVR